MTDSKDTGAIGFTGYLDVSTYMRMDKHLNPEKMGSLSGLVALVVLIPLILHVFKGMFSSIIGILVGFGSCIVVGGLASSYLESKIE